MVEPKNGKNPLVQTAKRISLLMPGEGELEDEEYDEGEWDTEEWEDEELPEALSEDEQVNGAFSAPPSGYDERAKKKRRRRPPMPRTPKPEYDEDEWEPPFEVLEDGTVVGPTLGDAGTELPPGFDKSNVQKGSYEGVLQIFRPQGSGGNPLPPA